MLGFVVTIKVKSHFSYLFSHTSYKKPFLYILHVLGYTMCFALGYLDVYIQRYGQLKLNGFV